MYFFWIIFIYSFLGFLFETLFSYLQTGRLENRKTMVLLPMCPVYGLSAAVVIMGSAQIKDRLPLLFAGGVMFASSVEYLYSLFCEKAFKIILWDYGKSRLSIDGRVHAVFSVIWGLLTVALYKYIQPYIDRFIGLFGAWQSAALLTVFFSDILLTSFILFRYGRRNGDVYGIPAQRLKP